MIANTCTCGKSAAILTIPCEEGRVYGVGCAFGCDRATGLYDKRTDAIKEWNKLVKEDTPK